MASFGGDRCESFHNLLWHLLMTDRVEEAKIAKVVMIAWALWCNRNEVRNGGKRKMGCKVIYWADTYLAEYTTAVEAPCVPATMVELSSFWTPLPAPLFKVNVDGVVFSTQGTVGISVIIRDKDGKVEAALSKKIIAPLGAMEVEAKAFEARILFAKDIGIQEFILEGDSIIIHTALCKTSNPPPLVEPVILGMHTLYRDFHWV